MNASTIESGGSESIAVVGTSKAADKLVVHTEERKYKTPAELRAVSADEEIIQTRETVNQHHLEGGTSAVFLVELRDDGQAVFKPKDGESRITCVERGTGYKRERAAYLVDKFLDFGMIPETMIREIDNAIGSAQRFVSNAQSGRQLTNGDREKITSEMKKLWLLDYIIMNHDRHEGNFLVQNGRVVAIDHALAFDSFHPSVSTYAEQIENWAFPQDAVESIAQLAGNSEMKRVLLELLQELISKKEADDCISRIENLATELLVDTHSQDNPYLWADNEFKKYRHANITHPAAE